MNKEKGDFRFEMTKNHHKNTFQKAIIDGKVDIEFIKICEFLTKNKNYFSTSCCAGRIALMCLDEKEGKKENAFYRKWHRKVTKDEVIKAIDLFNGDCLWFKQEPLILHVGTKNIEYATKIIKASHNAGIKRAGIIVAKEGKFIVEILGAKNINTPIKGKNFCVDKNYLKNLIRIANKKFVENQKSIKLLQKEIKKELK
jgi:tRNA(Phe) wybutosine-synthesizing methylase Tyw3